MQKPILAIAEKAEALKTPLKNNNLENAGRLVKELRGLLNSLSPKLPGQCINLAHHVAAGQTAIGDYYLATERFDQARKAYEKSVAFILDKRVPENIRTKSYFAAIRGLVRLKLAQHPMSKDALGKSCSIRSAKNGNIRALLIGVQTFPKLPNPFFFRGPINDVALAKSALIANGTKNQNIVTLAKDEVTMAEVSDAMRALVDQTKCGDFVVFHYSGSNWEPVASGISSALPGWQSGLLFSDTDEKSLRNGTGVLWGPELSEFVTALRNRGANVLLSLDAGRDAGLAIQYYQEMSSNSTAWRAETNQATRHLRAATSNSSYLTPILPGAADYAAFYASAADSQSVERSISTENDKKYYGVFSFALAKALQSAEQITVAELATKVAKTTDSITSPVFESSNPGMVVLEPVSPSGAGAVPTTRGFAPTGGVNIKILKPTPSKDGNSIEISGTKELKIVGKVEPVDQLGVLTIENQRVWTDEKGQFSHKVILAEGQRSIALAAMDKNFGFQPKVLNIGSGNSIDVLRGKGRRYALIIGNKDYNDPNITDLTTPHADAKDLAQVLHDKYGFLTEIEKPDGSKIPLLLLNATRADIHTAFSRLKRQLSKDDLLLVYYAGHGNLIKDSDGQVIEAYWIPVDGKADDEGNWIGANQITIFLRQIHANNVLVIADSCYSGALSRNLNFDTGEENQALADKSRRRFLSKLSILRSRMLMSSGGEEPVLDQGCSGHSIFSCALLKGLREMDREAFSVSHLFKSHIEEAVGGSAKQVPQYKFLRDSGHKGGDVVLVKSKPKSNPAYAGTPAKE